MRATKASFAGADFFGNVGRTVTLAPGKFLRPVTKNPGCILIAPMGEREPQHERLSRGDLLCLAHPGAPDVFSGYGVLMQDDWPGRMAGLLMVDRPYPADAAWLAHIADLYGACEVFPLTARDDRGLLCQMNVAPDSLQHLRRFSPVLDHPLQEVLRPLLEDPPAPTLLVHWDEKQRLWQSETRGSHGLPLAIREVFEHTGYGCLAAQSEEGVVHVCHTADKNITTFVDKPIKARWGLIEMPTAPLIRLELLVYDDWRAPYCFESFLNVGLPDHLAVLNELAGQENLYLAFYGDDLTYRYTSVVAHGEQQWQLLDDIIASAELYWQRLPEWRRDFPQAKALFMTYS